MHYGINILSRFDFRFRFFLVSLIWKGSNNLLLI